MECALDWEGKDGAYSMAHVSACRKCKRERKAEMRRRRGAIEGDLEEAANKGQAAKVWSLRRELSDLRVGPKQRR